MGIITEIINKSTRQFHFVECTELGGIICPLIRMNDYDVYLYDCGLRIDSLLSFFNDQQIDVRGIIEPDKRWRGKTTHSGIPYYWDEEISQINTDPCNAIVIIASDSFYGIKQMQIISRIYNAGIDKIYAMTGNDMYQAYGTSDPREWTREWYIREFADQFEYTYDLLYDDYSRSIMEEWVKTFVCHKKWSLPQCDTRNKYLFDGVTVNDRVEIYKHLKDEVWVNCGACMGDSVLMYFDAGLDAKKIYAFEGDETSYKQLRMALELLPEELRNKIKPVKKYISKDTNFSGYIKDKVTLLNADIQGNELDMLEAMKNIIVSDRPVIAICIYHKAFDLVEIPQYINSIVRDYRYIIRKYTADVISSTSAWELVLYAVPNERAI